MSALAVTAVTTVTTVIATAHTDSMSVFDYLIAYWWVLFLFGGAILEIVGDVFSSLYSMASQAVAKHHKRKLKLKRLELEIEQTRSGTHSPDPGMCRHRKAVPVRDNAGTVVAWLCQGCDEQLPAGFSIYEEDL